VESGARYTAVHPFLRSLPARRGSADRQSIGSDAKTTELSALDAVFIHGFGNQRKKSDLFCHIAGGDCAVGVCVEMARNGCDSPGHTYFAGRVVWVLAIQKSASFEMLNRGFSLPRSQFAGWAAVPFFWIAGLLAFLKGGLKPRLLDSAIWQSDESHLFSLFGAIYVFSYA
jgi:hypothetical protein